MIKILNREYGDACLIVGVADGTGSAEDPEGLSHSELLRLFEEGLPISEYRFNKVCVLSGVAWMVPARWLWCWCRCRCWC